MARYRTTPFILWDFMVAMSIAAMLACPCLAPVHKQEGQPLVAHILTMSKPTFADHAEVHEAEFAIATAAGDSLQRGAIAVR